MAKLGFGFSFGGAILIECRRLYQSIQDAVLHSMVISLLGAVRINVWWAREQNELDVSTICCGIDSVATKKVLACRHSIAFEDMLDRRCYLPLVHPWLECAGRELNVVHVSNVLYSISCL